MCQAPSRFWIGLDEVSWPEHVIGTESNGIERVYCLGEKFVHFAYGRSAPVVGVNCVSSTLHASLPELFRYVYSENNKISDENRTKNK